MGKQAAIKRARREANEIAAARNPMTGARRYVNATVVFGGPITPNALIDRIKTFNWRDSFVRLGQLAADVAQDNSGPRSTKVQKRARSLIAKMTSTDRAAIARAHAWARSSDDSVIVHEEAIDFLQHLVLMYGLEEGEAPSEMELVLWLIGAGDFLGLWEDESNADGTERLIAEIARVSRFNNAEDPLNLLVRVRDMFGTPPFAGALSNPETWARIQQAAFGQPFEEHFATRVLPLLAESMFWGSDGDKLPVIAPAQWVRNLGPTGELIVRWVFDLAKSREEIVDATRARMMPDGVLPRAPTALLRNPIVRLSEDRVAIASPWRVLSHLRTGVWAAFLNGTKAVLGKKSGEWFPAFGYMFEQWLRRVAAFAVEGGAFRGTLVLPTFPGSQDEVDDVVVVDGNITFLFSAKARLMEEPIARWARSPRGVMDWYEKYFFDAGDDDFRAGAVRQFDSRIRRIRAGVYKQVPKDNRIVPILVTYDSLCEEFLLYDWLERRNKECGLLLQENVSPLSLAHVDDFERLMARAHHGRSLRDFFRVREERWKGRRLESQLGGYEPNDRLPQIAKSFETMMSALTARFAARSTA